MASILSAASTARSLLVGVGEPSIDNWTFRLFYQYSTSILLACSILVTSNQFFGDPIQCDLPGGGVSDDTLKSYCWMYSTFNIPMNFTGNCARKNQNNEQMYNTYYQWVSLCLVGQACLFYLPRALWLSMEGGLMKHLARDKQTKIVEKAEEKCENLLKTFNTHLHNKYDRYFFAFLGCEIVNVVIVICQVFITDKFLENHFLTYGTDVYWFYNIPEEEAMLDKTRNPMCETFPRVASCTYWRYGGGGHQTSLNALCILALNIIIDKVYLLLWIWYVILIIFGGLRLLQRLCQTFPYVRYHMMRIRMYRYFRSSSDTENIRTYLADCSIGDWFVLYQMSKNMNKRLFFMFITQLSKTPKSQILLMLPQIRVVNAFKDGNTHIGTNIMKLFGSKESPNGSDDTCTKSNVKKSDDEDNDDYFSHKKEESPGNKKDGGENREECKKRRNYWDEEEEEHNKGLGPEDIEQAKIVLGHKNGNGKSGWIGVSNRYRK